MTRDSNGPWHGRFVWHDLMTTDARKSVAFYTALFDWSISETPIQGFTYRMIHAGPGPIGGIIEEKEIPSSHWMPYCSVPGVDAAAKRVQELGGSVCVPPTDIPQTGRFAVVGDPQGAYFSLYTGLPESQGFDPDQSIPGRVVWNELMTADDAGAEAFYGALFGWKPQHMDMGPMGTYRCQMVGEKGAGAIMKNPMPNAPSWWCAYFLAPDLAAATVRAKQLGAQALMENVAIQGGMGHYSLMKDPTGAHFGLYQAP